MTPTGLSSGPITAVDSLQHQLVVAIERQDREGFNLLLQLAMTRLGSTVTGQLAAQLPSIVNADRVPAALQFLHGDRWQHIARQICIAATHDLIKVGVALGEQISLGVADNGSPILYMKHQVHDALEEIAPHSLHLISSFLCLE